MQKFSCLAKLMQALLLFFVSLPSFGQSDPNPPDWEEAQSALRILGAAVDNSSQRCAGCHSPDRILLKRWMIQTTSAKNGCLEKFDTESKNSATPEEAVTAIDCLARGSDTFLPRNLGIFAAGADLTFFRRLFTLAYPNDVSRYNNFVRDVKMPPNGHSMSDEEFQKVIRWTLKQMPLMEQALGDVPLPLQECRPEITPALKSHISEMAQTGWQAKNQESGILHFGCDINGEDCFQQRDSDGNDRFRRTDTLPVATNWRRLAGTDMRILADVPYITKFFVRSSADGRFVSYGIKPAAPDDQYRMITMDLQAILNNPASTRHIPMHAMYDPSYFPDNSGFLAQGVHENYTAGCFQSVLENPATAAIDFTENNCFQSDQLGLYQSLGTDLNGGDHKVIEGPYDSAPGLGPMNETPRWTARTDLEISITRPEASSYRILRSQKIWLPYEGDFGVSPSNRILASRVVGADENWNSKLIGYRLSRIIDDGTNITIEPVGQLCLKGGKAVFSLDERWITSYHRVNNIDWQELGYASASDPEFLRLVESGTTNIILADLLSGTSATITALGAGQLALFPHFRSDGWIYFLVFDQNTNKRYIVASDAARVLANRKQ